MKVKTIQVRRGFPIGILTLTGMGGDCIEIAVTENTPWCFTPVMNVTVNEAIVNELKFYQGGVDVTLVGMEDLAISQNFINSDTVNNIYTLDFFIPVEMAPV